MNRWLVTVTLCMLPSTGWAQGGTVDAGANAALSTSGAPSYEQMIQAAIEEFALQNYIEARSLFLEAHRLAPSARTLGFEVQAEWLRATKVCEEGFARPCRSGGHDFRIGPALTFDWWIP